MIKRLTKEELFLHGLAYMADHPRRDLKTFRLLCKAELEHYELIERLEPFSSENFEELYGFFEDYGGIALKSVRFLRTMFAMEGHM